MNKVPGWLSNTSYTVSTRPHLPVDDVEEDGTVFNVVKRRPSYRFKVAKKAAKRVAETEEWIDFLRKKGKIKE